MLRRAAEERGNAEEAAAGRKGKRRTERMKGEERKSAGDI
jgi:hypothetical protein